MSRHAWIDASAGVAGDMLLGALVDAGAELAAVQACVDAVVPGAVRLTSRPVLRAGQSGSKVDVEVLTADLPERHWSEIESMLADADLPHPVRDRAHRTFARLAEAEAAVHGISVAEVHFHEVGALDSIADVVGVCAALHLLGVESLSAGPVAVGSGRIRTAHGDIAVPVPAVVQLSTGWRLLAGGRGELATPTGMALVTALSECCEDLPALLLRAAGSGAGTKDDPDRANLTRVLIGDRAAPAAPPSGPDTETLTVLEANVDDLDPRLWPGVLARLLAEGALDAWLVPILMKKGRPAHTLAVLTRPAAADRLQQVIFTETSTLGVRRSTWERAALDRGWLDVSLARDGDADFVAVKVAHRQGRIVSATPEFTQVERVAAASGEPVRTVLARAAAAATTTGLTAGAAVPVGLRDAADSPEGSPDPALPSGSPDPSFG